MEFALTAFDEWLEPIKRIAILQRNVSRTNHAQNSTSILSERGTVRDRDTVNGLQILQTYFPVESAQLDGLADRWGFFEDFSQTVPWGLTNSEHVFDAVRHNLFFQLVVVVV